MRGGCVKFKFPFIRPNFPLADEMIEDYTAIVESNWFTNFGPYEKRLSKESAEYVGEGVYATTVSNCTAGLEMAIAELFTQDLGKKKVIMPSFTFVAGAEALIRNNLTPVLIDIDEQTWQPSINQAREILSTSVDDIAGILLCNIFGVGNRDIEQWESLSAEYEIPLIIDSAAGFGSYYTQNERIGGRGDCEIFSLHATKPFSVGEGGLITSRNESFIEKMRSAQNFGFESDRNVHRIGTNAKMQEFSCAIGLRQLKKLSSKVLGRQKAYLKYKQKLGAKGYSFQDNTEFSTVAFVSTLIPANLELDAVKEKFVNGGVEARRYYVPALHQQEILIRYCETPLDLSVTNQICDRIISIPLYESMTEEDIEYVCSLI